MIEDQINRSHRLVMMIPKEPSSPLEKTNQSDLKTSSIEYPVTSAIIVSKTEPTSRKMNMAKFAAEFIQNIPTDDKTQLTSAEIQENASEISSQTSLQREEDDDLKRQYNARHNLLLSRLNDQIMERERLQTNDHPHCRYLGNSHYLDA